MVSLPAVANGKPVVIQVAGSLDDVHNVLESATILFGIMAAALLAAVGAAGVLTRRAFRGINDVVKQARLIGDANLGERLPHPGTPDEIGQLVDTLNAMLDRLEQAFDQQRRFTADASHELRSPLSRLRTEIEVTLRRPRESQEYVDTLRSCLDEVGRLTRLIEELLMLARFDAGQDRQAGEPQALDALIAETLLRAGPAARERQVELVARSARRAAPRCARIGGAGAGQSGGQRAQVLATGQQDRGGLRRRRAPRHIARHRRRPRHPPDELPFLFDRFFRGAGRARPRTREWVLGWPCRNRSSMPRAAYRGASGPDGGAVFTVRFRWHCAKPVPEEEFSVRSSTPSIHCVPSKLAWEDPQMDCCSGRYPTQG
jgi:two-component system OmpR family sensor kinase